MSLWSTPLLSPLLELFNTVHVSDEHLINRYRMVIEPLEAVVYHTHITQYTLAAGFIIWAYDLLLTFGDEVELIWKKGARGLVRLLYFLVSKGIWDAGRGIYARGELILSSEPVSTTHCTNSRGPSCVTKSYFQYSMLKPVTFESIEGNNPIRQTPPSIMVSWLLCTIRGIPRDKVSER